jgi:hypothetical protein
MEYSERSAVIAAPASFAGRLSHGFNWLMDLYDAARQVQAEANKRLRREGFGA